MKRKKEADGRHNQAKEQPPSPAPSGLVNAPESHPHADRSGEDVETAAPTPQERKKRRNWPRCLSVLTLLVLAAQAVILWQQARILGDTNELSRNDQRAWVGVGKMESQDGAKEIREGVPVSVNLVWKNFGRGPARQIDCAVGIRLMARSETFDADYGTKNGPEGTPETIMSADSGTLWPGVIYRSPRVSRVFTQQEATAIQRGEQKLYVYGKSTYRDAFNRPHWTHFCSRFDPERRKWSLHDTYNDAN